MRFILSLFLLFSSSVFAEDWKPTTEMEKLAKATFDQYSKVLHNSKFESAYAMYTDGFKSITNFDDWKSHKVEFLSGAGAFITYSDMKFTWYKDPEHAPLKGIYSAIDFKCEYEKLGFCSGTLILYSKDGTQFKVMREESNTINKSILTQLTNDGVLDDNGNIVLKPFPTAKVTQQQWQSYQTAVNIMFVNTRRVIPEQGLELYTDNKSGTMYTFTTASHPAHPSWIVRYIYERDGSIGIGQTGYFAGKEEPFAELYRQYQELNNRARKEMQSK